MFDPEIVFFLFSLLGAFAALLWLRPGKREAARYALIVLCFGALCYLLSDKAQPPIPRLPVYITMAMPVLVFLLGMYMLRCPWRRVVLSLGIYVLVSALANLTNLLYAGQPDRFCHVDILLSFSTYLEVLWIWLFIRLGTRKAASIRATDCLLAAAAYVCIARLVLLLCNYLVPYLALAVEPRAAMLGITGAVYLLCLGGMLRYVLRQPWKRSLRTAVVFVAIWLGSTCLAQYLIDRTLSQLPPRAIMETGD
ncbi:MAG: hypothetical protein IJ943_05695 [Akkermansia sp.]|nr:hypothetical protein [Akkermansia sp.]